MKFSKSLSALFLAVLVLFAVCGVSAQIIYPEVDPYADPQTIKQIIGGIIDLYKEFGGPDGDLPTTFFVGDRIYKVEMLCGNGNPVPDVIFFWCMTFDKDLSEKHSVGDVLLMEKEGLLPKEMIVERFTFLNLQRKIINYDKKMKVNFGGTDIVPITGEGDTVWLSIFCSKISGTAIAKERTATVEELRKMIAAFRYHLTEIDTALRFKIIEKGPRP